jgi:ribose transport system substrate-binding protein
MRFFDRDKQPVRFAVATSILSGLTVALVVTVVGKAVGKVAWADLLTWQVPLWSLLAAVVAMVALVAVIPARRRDEMSDRVFVIIPAFRQKHWISQLMHDMNRALDRRGTEMVLKIPDDDYLPAGQMHHLRRVIAQRAHFVGGMLIPVELEHHRQDIATFCERLAKPVVMIDIEPFDDEQDYPPRTAFVGYDAAGIGECAAEWVVRQLATTTGEPSVLVIGAGLQRRRQQRFVEVVTKKVPTARIVVHENSAFARMRAREIVEASLLAAGRAPAIIFCTSDELALGAVDALVANGQLTTRVIGVDGTQEAISLIDTGQSPLRATVVQNSYRVSEIAVDLLERMLRGERVRIRNLLTAEVYDAAKRTATSSGA